MSRTKRVVILASMFISLFSVCNLNLISLGEEKDYLDPQNADKKIDGVLLSDSFSFCLDGKRLLFSGVSKEETWNTSVEKMFRKVENTGQREDAFPRDEVIRERYEHVNKKSGIKVVFELDRYEYYPVSEGVLWLENISDSDSPNLKEVCAFDGVLPTGGLPFLTAGRGEDPDPVQNYSLQRFSLQPGTALFFEPMEGYPSYGAFPYFLLEGKLRSYIIAIGWTGSWHASFDVDKLGNVHFCAGQKDVDLYLKPGEKIRTPRITLFDFPTGADAVNLWRDWYRRYVMPRENGIVLRPKFVLDVFYRGELYDKVTAEEQIDAIRKLRSLGYPCEGLWVDAGWYLRGDKKIDSAIGRWFAVGDWTPDPNRFPDGFRPVVEELENVPEGTPPGKLTLWYEPERVHRSTLNEELKAFVVPACEIVESFRMNMASKETVDYLSETIGRSLAENKVKIYRQDSNGAGPALFIEALESSTSDYSGRKGYAENLYVRGLYSFWDNLKKDIPDLIFDSCASGGRRNDLEMLRLGAVPLHYSDVGYFDFVEKQHMHDTLDRWFIYYKNIDPHDYDFEKGQYDVYKTTIDLAPFSTVRPYFIENPSSANRKYADRYFAIRELLVDGDYYLLRGGFTDHDWTVRQFDDSRQENASGHVVSYAKDSVRRYIENVPVPSGKRQVGCVIFVRNEKNDEEKITVKLQKIDPDGTYLWENLENGEVITLKGSEMIEKGMNAVLPPKSGATFKYTRVK